VLERERRFLSGCDFWDFLHKRSTRLVNWLDEVDAAFCARSCSVCDSRAGPKGLQGLGMREWQWSLCEAIHDRNVNAAQIILAAGHRGLAEGISVL
jgi:hypothetical protein